jgi:hypothetical protein
MTEMQLFNRASELVNYLEECDEPTSYAILQFAMVFNYLRFRLNDSSRDAEWLQRFSENHVEILHGLRGKLQARMGAVG